MSGIDHADIIDKKEKVKRADLERSNTDYISGVTHAVDLVNQAPMFALVVRRTCSPQKPRKGEQRNGKVVRS